ALGVNKTGVGTWVLAANNTYTGSTNVAAGKLVLAAPLTTSSAVSVQPAAKLDLATGGGNTLVTPSLTIAGATDAWTGQVSIHDNDVIVRSTAANRVAKVDEITNQLKQGLNAT